MRSILIINQALEIQIESTLRQMKSNIHVYNFHEET